MKKKVILLGTSIALIMLLGITNESFTQRHSDELIAEKEVKTYEKVEFGYHPGNYKHPLKAKKAKKGKEGTVSETTEKMAVENYKMPLRKTRRRQVVLENSGQPQLKNYKMPKN